MKKQNLFLYVVISVLVFTLYIGQTKATNYENYFGIEMTNQEYNNLLNLGFSEDEIYYMNEETYLNNKDINAELVATTDKYYKTVYVDLAGNEYTTEISKEEYDNQGNVQPRGTVTTEYKHMVGTMSKTGDRFRYKVSLSWRNMPSVRSYDIIGIGFADNIYIASIIHFNYTHCNIDAECSTDSDFYGRKNGSTGATTVYKFPTSARSMTAVMYYDVAKNTSNTITELSMCGDYAHATSSVSYDEYTGHNISIGGIGHGVHAGKYDAIPCAESSWGGTW